MVGLCNHFDDRLFRWFLYPSWVFDRSDWLSYVDEPIPSEEMTLLAPQMTLYGHSSLLECLN